MSEAKRLAARANCLARAGRGLKTHKPIAHDLNPAGQSDTETEAQKRARRKESNRVCSANYMARKSPAELVAFNLKRRIKYRAKREALLLEREHAAAMQDQNTEGGEYISISM